MRAPAAWPLHTASTTRPSHAPATDGTKQGAPPPDSKPNLTPSPLGPAQSKKSAEPLLRRRAAGASASPTPHSRSSPSPSSSSAPPSSPNPPSLELILAATSVDEPTDRERWARPGFLIAALASAGVLVPCLVGAAFTTLSPNTPPLGIPSLGGTDKVSSLPPPRAVPTISAARENGVASGDPRASAPNPHPERLRSRPPRRLRWPSLATPAATPDLSPPPGRSRTAVTISWPRKKDARGEELRSAQAASGRAAAEPVAASPAAAPATLPAAEAVANAERRIAALESDKKALAAEVSRLERDREAPTQTKSIRSPTLAGPVQEPNSGPGSQAAVDAEKRIAALESDKEALTAEVRRLERDREASEKASVAPAAATAIPAAESAPGIWRVGVAARGHAGARADPLSPRQRRRPAAGRKSCGCAQETRRRGRRPSRKRWRRPDGRQLFLYA